MKMGHKWQKWILFALVIMVGVLPGIAQEAVTAVTLVDDFDRGYEPGEISGWWVYSKDFNSVMEATIDPEQPFNGTAALRIDADIPPDGYAGMGLDFSFARDWTAGSGLVMQMRATAPGLPIHIVFHVDDETQTSSFSPGVTPFGCEFATPEGSDQGWTQVILPWECFERRMWVGPDGLMVFSPNPISSFEIAFENVGDTSITGTIWIDDIRVVSDTDLNAPPSFGDVFGDIPVVQANQIGYRPNDRKYFVSVIPAAHFTVVDDATGEVAFAGLLIDQGHDPDVDRHVLRGDFTGLTEPGTYRIVLSSFEESTPFTISDDVYSEPLWLATRYLYLQRSGIAINDAEISGITLEAGHTQPAQLWGDTSGATLDVTGGWYDAGDYGRFIPTATFAVNQLLYAYSANPGYFGDGTLNIPESGNGVPDLLDEIRWELDWLLKMQREDGAVYHKVTTRAFPNYGTLPAEDAEQMYVFDISSADTAYFAAVTAQASLIYRELDPAYADHLLARATLAGEWLLAHPEQVPEGGFQNPPISEYPMQGGYDFVGVEDIPRMWASAELFKATGDTRYATMFAGHFAAAPQTEHTMVWANCYPMALYAYLTAANADVDTRAAVEAVFQAQAENIYQVVISTGYNVALTDAQPGFEYEWGSNQVALAHGLYLMLANELYPNSQYVHAALGQIHYVLGVNPLAKAYISGLGANPVLEPHHNVSFHLRAAVPGIITEGANSQNTGGDARLQGLWDIGVPAAMRYVDDWDSWATNEPTIDANATFVALLAHFAPEGD